MIVLQFNTLPQLAAYSKVVSNKGYRINTQLLTFQSQLSRTELELALKDYSAKISTNPLEKA